MSIHPTHQLYKPSDFEDEPKETTLERMVCNGGLDVCKLCSDYEAGLAAPCSHFSMNLVIEINAPFSEGFTQDTLESNHKKLKDVLEHCDITSNWTVTGISEDK